MSNPVVDEARKLLSKHEGFYRLDPKTGLVRSYPDPASELAQSLIARGLWQKYLRMQAGIPLSMTSLSGKPWTIGMGVTGPDVGAKTVWTAEQCVQREDAEISEKLTALMKLVGHLNLPVKALGALLSFVYNVGLDAFHRSTLFEKLAQRDWQAAAAQFDRWVYAQGKKLPGLVARRTDEKALFLAGIAEMPA